VINSIIRNITGLVTTTALLTLIGCTQMPTERQGVIDLRSQISFRLDGLGLEDARVKVDEVEAGLVGDYVDGKSSLKVMPGTHNVKVVSGSKTILDEKFYIGDGVSRSFTLK